MEGCSEWGIERRGGEKGYVEGVVLLFVSTSRRRVLIRRMLMVTFLPITPRQAIEGMAVIIGLNVVRLTGSNRSRDLVEVR